MPRWHVAFVDWVRNISPGRCEACRGWTLRAAGSHCVVYTTATEGIWISRRVCGACWQRHLDLEPAVRQARQEQFEEKVRDYRRWLEHAPRRAPTGPNKKPDPVDPQRVPLLLPPRPGQEQGTTRFDDVVLERTQWSDGAREHWVLDIDTAAEQLALRDEGSTESYIRGPDAEQVGPVRRCAHAGALSMMYGFDDYRDHYTGSAFRIDASRILIVWKREDSSDLGR